MKVNKFLNKSNLLGGLILNLLSLVFFAQSESSMGVHYMVDYDAAKQTYTVWVVPQYNTPNRNNPDTEERGATAQVTLKVPSGFELIQLEDIRGAWDKSPGRLGNEAAFIKAGISSGFMYYVIGKQPIETNYGTFQEGEPVALFRFKGKGATSEAITVLDSNDPFVRIANKTMALNVGNSFYSRSGQLPRVTARPLEQFSQPITLENVMNALAKKVSLAVKTTANIVNDSVDMITFPNPATDRTGVMYFSKGDGAKTRFELVDASGQVRYETVQVAKQGVNSFEINLNKLPSGSYLLRAELDKKMIIKKLSKIE